METSEGRDSTSLGTHRDAPYRWLPARPAFPISNRLDDLKVHRGTPFDTGDFARTFGPMSVFAKFALSTSAERHSLRLVTSAKRIRCS